MKSSIETRQFFIRPPLLLSKNLLFILQCSTSPSLLLLSQSSGTHRKKPIKHETKGKRGKMRGTADDNENEFNFIELIERVQGYNERLWLRGGTRHKSLDMEEESPASRASTRDCINGASVTRSNKIINLVSPESTCALYYRITIPVARQFVNASRTYLYDDFLQGSSVSPPVKQSAFQSN